MLSCATPNELVHEKDKQSEDFGHLVDELNEDLFILYSNIYRLGKVSMSVATIGSLYQTGLCVVLHSW